MLDNVSHTHHKPRWIKVCDYVCCCIFVHSTHFPHFPQFGRNISTHIHKTLLYPFSLLHVNRTSFPKSMVSVLICRNETSEQCNQISQIHSEYDMRRSDFYLRGTALFMESSMTHPLPNFFTFWILFHTHSLSLFLPSRLSMASVISDCICSTKIKIIRIQFTQK